MEISLSWLIIGFLGQLFFSARFIYKNKKLVSHSVNFYSNPQHELV